jgi:hypothetical protein
MLLFLVVVVVFVGFFSENGKPLSHYTNLQNRVKAADL